MHTQLTFQTIDLALSERGPASSISKGIGYASPVERRSKLTVQTAVE